MTTRNAEGDLLDIALGLQRLNRCREIVFGEHCELFRDPAWDMLIETFVADRRGRPVHIKTLTNAANVPATTALRWVREIERAGLIMRTQSEEDRRAAVVALTDQGRRFLSAYLVRIGDAVGSREA